MASIGRRKRLAFSDAVRSRQALRTLWHNACISYRRYEKSMNKFRLSFFELMTASIGRRKRIAFLDAVRSRRALRTLWHNACISYRRYEKSVNVSFYIFFELMTASKGRRKRIAFSDAVRSRQALRTLWHNACISYRRYEKSVNVSFYIFFELMTASKGRRKRIAFSDAVRSRRALRTLWHNACISYRRYEKSMNVTVFLFLS